MATTRRYPSATPGAIVLLAALVALLTLLAFAGTMPGGLSNAEAADSTIFNDLHWRLLPSDPCQGDSIVLVFDVCTCNNHFVSGERLDASHVRLELNVRPDIVCIWCNPDTLRLGLGAYPPGSHEIDLLAVANVTYGDGHTEVIEKHFVIPFFVQQCTAGAGGLGNGETVALGPAYPNPLRREAQFALTLATAEDVDLAVFDLAGRRIATVYKGRMLAGTRLFTWQRTRDGGRGVASGVYFYRATAGDHVVSRKLMVLSRE
jgi:hypothetical protein